MIVKTNGNDLIISDVKDFNITHIFECGQCFRWDKEVDGSFTGVALGKALNISFKENEVLMKNTLQEDFELLWKNYFDFDTDYSQIKTVLSSDETVKKAISYGNGIRILNQDLWECIISFIISANNNIPRIKGIVKRFCENFGKKITYLGSEFYTFPSPDELSGITVSDLAPLRAGFRDKYIVDAVNKVNSGEVCLKTVINSDINTARNELLKIKGVGRKVADCVLLFGAGKRASFPVDVWVKRVMAELYAEEIKDGDIFAFAENKFGENAGIAQQYLFYYMREKGEEKK